MNIKSQGLTQKVFLIQVWRYYLKILIEIAKKVQLSLRDKVQKEIFSNLKDKNQIQNSKR